MPGLDPRSFLIISAIPGLLYAFILFASRRSFPGDIPGLNHRAWACLVMIASACLFTLGDKLPMQFSGFPTGILLAVGSMLMINRRRQLHLERIAARDRLTGTDTRKAYLDLVGNEIARTHRFGEPLSLLMVNIDDFKATNDQHGQLVGDRVLVDFVQKVNRILRAQDIFGRYGRGEFSILLPNTSQESAYRLANRICVMLAQSSSQDLPRYTVSIGATTMRHDEHLDIHAFARQADRALYQATERPSNGTIKPSAQSSCESATATA